MQNKTKMRLAVATLSTALAAALLLAAAEWIGVSPNLGLPFGYYGRLNQVLAKLEANPDLEVREVRLHRDRTLEDFYITVRKADGADVDLRFEGADERPFDELLEELGKVGM